MSELVVKDNALINASYSLSLVEQRLILLAIVATRKDDHDCAWDFGWVSQSRLRLKATWILLGYLGKLPMKC